MKPGLWHCPLFCSTEKNNRDWVREKEILLLTKVNWMESIAQPAIRNPCAGERGLWTLFKEGQNKLLSLFYGLLLAVNHFCSTFFFPPLLPYFGCFHLKCTLWFEVCISHQSWNIYGASAASGCASRLAWKGNVNLSCEASIGLDCECYPLSRSLSL